MRIVLIFFMAFIGLVAGESDAAGTALPDFLFFKDTSRIRPVIPGDLADPSVIRVGSNYYATGTSSEWAPHYPLFKSADLIHWKQLGYIFDKTPEWASSSFWAPELLYRNGTYYIYYTARKKSDGISCIGVATSKDPEKGFTDRGIVVDFGKEAIDAFVVEENGKWYITFKAYGLDSRPIELLGYQLSDDGLKTVGEPFMLLRDDEKIGLEGQSIIKRDNYYYLFYSAGGCCGAQCSYHVNVARSRSLKGPYIKYERNPVVDAFDGWKCTGHGTIVTNKKGEDYYLYHAYDKITDVHTGRQGMLAKLNWDKQTGWPSFHPVSGEEAAGFTDEFSGTTLNTAWQWDFRNSQLVVHIKNGRLYLSGQVKPGNNTGTALTVRPFYANYEISTAVVNDNESLKGLTVYGDANQAIGMGVKGNLVEVWYVKDNSRKVLKMVKVNGTGSTHLKMVVSNGCDFSFFMGKSQDKWDEIIVSDTDLKELSLALWDRSPRPGLLQQGHKPAIFDYFSISYF